MNQKKFKAILTLPVPQIVHLITENYGEDEITASKKLYESKLYAGLEREETKLWHLSALTLFNMYDEERNTGSITFPEEA